MIGIVLIGAVILLFWYYAIRPLNYWKNRGITQGNPIWLLGDQWKQILRFENFAEFTQRMYDLTPNDRYCGIYQFLTPTLVIRDPALLKQVTVKDFEHFMNHREFIPEGADPLWARNLLSLKDQRWKETRPILSPSFTSSKMKMMYTLMADCADNLVKHFKNKNQDVVDVNLKDLATRFANDVIATTAFGIHTDSLENPNNEFYLMGRDITNFATVMANIKIFGFVVFPKLFKFLGVNLFNSGSRQFFINLIDDTLKTREEKKIVRPDMINLLLEAKNGVHHKEHEKDVLDAGFATVNEVNTGKSVPLSREITNIDITAHALIFFFGGFDSVSSLMCFTSYELAVNPDIQTRLRQEIDEAFEQCKGKLTYESLIKMKYFDMVISESLRKWPNFPAMDRQCTKRYVIEPEDPKEKPLVIEEGTVLLLPIISIQNDPKYYPDPERFDPERFNDKNRDKINTYTYLPFGMGPRNCIGSRFAILETKVLFAYLLHNFEIVPTSKSIIPVELSKKHFNLHPVDGMQLGFKRLR